MYRPLIFILSMIFSISAWSAVVEEIYDEEATVQAQGEEVFSTGQYLLVRDEYGEKVGVVKIVSDEGKSYKAELIYGRAERNFDAEEIDIADKEGVFSFFKKKKKKLKKAVKKRRRKARKRRARNRVVDEEEEVAEEVERIERRKPRRRTRRKKSSQRAINISVDTLSLTGDLLQLPIMNADLEYRWRASWSLGIHIVFGKVTFDEPNPPAGGFPEINYLGGGVTLHYSFSGDVYRRGFYVSGEISLVDETWTKTTSFSGLNEIGIFTSGTFGYQYFIGGFNLRAGLRVRFSSLAPSVEERGVTYERDSYTTELSLIPVLLAGYAF